MKNSPEILALSNDAQAILAGHWMYGRMHKLTLNNVESRFTERSARAMQELIDAGLISEEPSNDGYEDGRVYRLTEKGAGLEYSKSFEWMKKHGRFKMMEKIPEAERRYPIGLEMF